MHLLLILLNAPKRPSNVAATAEEALNAVLVDLELRDRIEEKLDP